MMMPLLLVMTLMMSAVGVEYGWYDSSSIHTISYAATSYGSIDLRILHHHRHRIVLSYGE